MEIKKPDEKPEEDEEPKPELVEKEETPPVPEKKGRFGGGGIDFKSIAVNVIVAAVVVFIMTNVYPASLVSKKDFGINLNNTNNTVSQLSSSVNQKLADYNATLQGIPTSINTAISGATSTLNNQIRDLSGKLSDLQANYSSLNNGISSHTSKLSELQAKLDALSATVAGLSSNLTSAQTNNTALKSQLSDMALSLKSIKSDIDTLKSEIGDLQNQLASGSIVISTSSATYTLTSGVISSSPQTLAVSNNSTSNAVVHLVLTLTPTSSNVTSISDAAINRTTTSITISGTTVKFYTDLSVDANSSVTINPKVTLTYTGNSPNTFNAVWSKQ